MVFLIEISHQKKMIEGLCELMRYLFLRKQKETLERKEFYFPFVYKLKRSIVVSFQEKNLEIVLQELKSKGFGLTFGIHSRIESKATKISKLVGSGNSYINRDMIGAVVGTQPFGGSGLSGTGHKAGGPNYLIQFVNEKLVSINTVAIGGNAELLNLETENGNSQGT